MVADGRPLVRDVQRLSLLATNSLFDPSYQSFGLLTWIIIGGVMWDSQFWSILLIVPFMVALPVLAIYLQVAQTPLFYLDYDSFWRTIKRICDATTVAVWLPFYYLGLDLTKDRYVPFLLVMQWLLLPINTLLFGTWTILLFPVTVTTFVI